jgi:hypothetical protein
MLSFNVFADNNECSFKDEFSDEQWQVIQDAYQYGEPHNLGLTLASISVIESTAGVNVVNERTKSYGIPQIRIYTALNRLNLENTPRNQAKIKKRLINDNDFAYDMAIQELQYWLSVRSNWRDSVKSYNAGWNKNAGNGYMHSVVNTLRELEKCETYITA